MQDLSDHVIEPSSRFNELEPDRTEPRNTTFVRDELKDITCPRPIYTGNE